MITVKWPALIVKGETITQEQAEEIIFRTDRNFPVFYSNYEDLNKLASPLNGEDYEDWKKVDEFREKHKILTLNYLYNSRIASCYIGGPHGWVDWDGKIFTNNYNIGKWPSDEEVIEDASNIAKSFPFLKMEITLVNREHCSKENAGETALRLKIENGSVEILQNIYDSETVADSEYKSHLGVAREWSISPKIAKQKWIEISERIKSSEDSLNV